jgi:hypothetical protein
LRLKNEKHEDAIQAVHSDNGLKLETLISKPFSMTWVLNTSFRVLIRLPRMAWWKGKIEPCARWLG